MKAKMKESRSFAFSINDKTIGGFVYDSEAWGQCERYIRGDGGWVIVSKDGDIVPDVLEAIWGKPHAPASRDVRVVAMSECLKRVLFDATEPA